MFDELPETRKIRSKGKGRALMLALIAHVVVLTFVGVASLLAVESIEPPTISVVFLSAAAPPPPPPPPAPAKPRPKTPEETKPKPTEQVKPPSEIVQPNVVPEKLEKPAEAAAPDTGDSGVDGGVEGGVEGGVAGGVVGGKEGGVVGGTGEEPLHVGGDVVAPVEISRVLPRYPEVAKAARVQGIVILEAIINTEGQVEEVKVLRGHPLLDEAAKEAVGRWKFRPGMLNGKPVRVYFTLTVNFTLK